MLNSMREISRIIPDFNYQGRELELYHLDQKINDRGMYIDMPLVQAASKIAEVEQEYYNKRLHQLNRR